MAKNKGKNKAGKLGKKERKALEAREAELLAKLERKAAKKAAKVTEPEPSVGAKPKAGKSAKAKTIDAADAVLEGASTDEARAAAATAKAAATEATDDESPEAIKARVKAKRERRAELESPEYRESIDRNDEAAVAAYNAESAELGLNHFLTGAAERDRQAKRLKGDDVPASDNKLEAALHGPDDEAPAQAAQEVETDHGREFAVGTSVADETFASPSEAVMTVDLFEQQAGRNGYKIIQLNAEGKPDLKRDGTPRTVRQFTRVTTYIDNLDDTTNLERWKMRTLLEGVAIADGPDAEGISDDVQGAIPRVRDLMHVRDVAIGKAAKADRKGKLEPGERAQLEADATKAFKDAVNKLADELLEVGGVHEKANRGTNLHTLTEVVDRGETLPEDDESITPTDRKSVEAYTAVLEAAGVKVIDAEVVIVNDDLKYAGRLDRIVLYRPEGSARAKRVVLDIKSGRIDYGFLHIEQQVAMYSNGKRYDLETGERTPLGADLHLGLLLHLPQGEGTATLYELDLDRGRRANKLSGMVREHRTEAGRVDRGEHKVVATA